MKALFTFLVLLSSTFGYCQIGQLKGRVMEDNYGFPGLSVVLIRDSITLQKTQTDIDGNFKFENIPFGTYAILISFPGMREETTENIVLDTENKVIDLFYPKPCVFTEKVCPHGHSDEIIPIVYGFPSKKMMKKSDKNKIKLGGCTPFCEKWHCKKHDLDF